MTKEIKWGLLIVVLLILWKRSKPPSDTVTVTIGEPTSYGFPDGIIWD